MTTFDQLEPGLSLSSAPSSADLEGTSFAAILNVCDIGVPSYAVPTGVRLIQQAFEDSAPVPLPFIQAAVLELADCRGSGAATLVHCQVGQSRSPTVVALYWMGRDGLTWAAAIERMRAVRPMVQPHPFLTNEAIRPRIAESVRKAVEGDGSVLAAARSAAVALRLAHRRRGPDIGASSAWACIEMGLACGSHPRAATELLAYGVSGFLNLDMRGAAGYASSLPATARAATVTMMEDAPADPAALREAVHVVRSWRREGRTVFVHCTDGKSRSALVIALYLMVERGWDFASALWYIRQRRPGAYPRPQLDAARALARLGRV